MPKKGPSDTDGPIEARIARRILLKMKYARLSSSFGRSGSDTGLVFYQYKNVWIQGFS